MPAIKQQPLVIDMGGDYLRKITEEDVQRIKKAPVIRLRNTSDDALFEKTYIATTNASSSIQMSAESDLSRDNSFIYFVDHDVTFDDTGSLYSSGTCVRIYQPMTGDGWRIECFEV